MSVMDTSKEKIRYILQFFFDKGENARKAAENVNSVYGSNTVTANQAQFWFRRFRSGNLDVKDAPRSGRPIVENVDKIMEMAESDHYISTVSIAQELNIAQKTVWNHLEKAGYKKKLIKKDKSDNSKTQTGEVPYACSICGKAFSRRNTMTKHERTHSEELYTCETCGKIFRHRDTMIVHERIHTGEVPYQCNICGERFSQREAKVTHELNHIGEKPHVCDTCGKRFSRRNNLVKHERTHSGVKPYPGSTSGRIFSRRDNMLSHERLHKKDESSSEHTDDLGMEDALLPLEVILAMTDLAES